MKKYPVERFYVGKLNIGFKFNNLLVRRGLEKHDYDQFDLEYSTSASGAISLDGISYVDLTNWNERKRYDKYPRLLLCKICSQKAAEGMGDLHFRLRNDICKNELLLKAAALFYILRLTVRAGYGIIPL